MGRMSDLDIQRHNEGEESMPRRSNARRVRYAVFRTQRTARHWHTLATYRSVPWYIRLFRRHL
jgi:hypothetical protein